MLERWKRQLLERWVQAKHSHNYLAADRLREELRDLGVEPQMPRDGEDASQFTAPTAPPSPAAAIADGATDVATRRAAEREHKRKRDQRRLERKVRAAEALAAGADGGCSCSDSNGHELLLPGRRDAASEDFVGASVCK